MKRLASTLPNMVISLTLVTAIAGAILGLVYNVTKEPIEKIQQEAQAKAIQEVCPPYNNDPEKEQWVYERKGLKYTVYPARMNGELVGAAVKTLSMDGFSGEIDVMCGFEKDGTVKDYRVISHGETPGLGSKMEAWFRDPTGARSIIEKNPGSVSFYVVKDTEKGGEIDGITAATISSRAFLKSIRHAYKAYLAYQESHPSK